MARTLFDKIWDSHVVADLGDGCALLHIDRLLLHDLSGGRGRCTSRRDAAMRRRSRDLIFATPDHAISTAPGRTEQTFSPARR